MLGDMIYADETKNPRKVMIEMLHSCSPQANKETVLQAFQQEDSGLKVSLSLPRTNCTLFEKNLYRIGYEKKLLHVATYFPLMVTANLKVYAF